MRISKKDFEKVERILKRSFPEDFDGIVALSGAAVIWVNNGGSYAVHTIRKNDGEPYVTWGFFFIQKLGDALKIFDGKTNK